MKKAPLIFNILLALAVIVLYYLHFSSVKSAGELSAADSAALAKPVVMSPTEIKASKIVYINSDVLNEKYEFVKDLTAEAQSKQMRLQSTYEGKAQKFQQDYAELQEKASQGLLSENQATQAQNDMIKRKEELDKMELQLQSLMEEIQKRSEEVRKTVIDYVTEYNKKGQYNYILTYTESPGGFVILANDSLDITNDILNGLNAQYRAKKDAGKAKK